MTGSGNIARRLTGNRTVFTINKGTHGRIRHITAIRIGSVLSPRHRILQIVFSLILYCPGAFQPAFPLVPRVAVTGNFKAVLFRIGINTRFRRPCQRHIIFPVQFCHIQWKLIAAAIITVNALIIIHKYHRICQIQRSPHILPAS